MKSAVPSREVIGTRDSLPALPRGPAADHWSKELIRAIAMDIGKSAVHHLETMYPAAIKACPPNMKLSLRNHIHNEIMAALETTDADEIAERLRRRKEQRRKIKAIYTRVRR